MPPLYEKIRDQYAKGKAADPAYDRAQAIAAATYHKIIGKSVNNAPPEGEAKVGMNHGNEMVHKRR